MEKPTDSLASGYLLAAAGNPSVNRGDLGLVPTLANLHANAGRHRAATLSFLGTFNC
jgi:hypothetical protein